MKYFYSAINNSFYHSSLKSDYNSSCDGWPTDAIEINDEYYIELQNALTMGKIIKSDNKGRPIITEPVIDYVVEAEVKKRSLLNLATKNIGPLQDAVDFKIATDDEKVQLKNWQIFRININRIDTSEGLSIEWPDKP